MPDARPEDRFHLYVHWPFCIRKCPYCDFTSQVPERRWDADAWRAAYLAEIARLGRRTGPRTLGSIYFGGGTPSLAEPAVIGAVADAAARAWEPAPDLEISLEANPGTVAKADLRALRDAGVNRLSVGAQSFDPAGLAALGRIHSVDDTKWVLDWAHDIFPRLSLDLIAARPGQSPAAWAAELAEALTFAGEHVSVYQLTVEDGTPLSREVAAGRVKMPDEDAALAIFADTRRILAASGRPAYEVSNFARPGAECRHNLAVWRGADYGGIGPAAHGRLSTAAGLVATRHEPDPAAWLAGPMPPAETPLSSRERAGEVAFTALRTARGLEFSLLARLGVEPGEVLDPDAAAESQNLGLLARDAAAIRLTEAGFPVLDAVLSRLLRA